MEAANLSRLIPEVTDTSTISKLATLRVPASVSGKSVLILDSNAESCLPISITEARRTSALVLFCDSPMVWPQPAKRTTVPVTVRASIKAATSTSMKPMPRFFKKLFMASTSLHSPRTVRSVHSAHRKCTGSNATAFSRDDFRLSAQIRHITVND